MNRLRTPLATCGPPLARITDAFFEIGAPDAGRVAEAAEMKTLVLSHLIPADDPSGPDSASIEAARRHFDGRIIVGRDLLEI